MLQLQLESGVINHQQVGVIEDRLNIVVRSSDSPTERVFGSEVVPATESVLASSTPPPVKLSLLSVVVIFPTPNTKTEPTLPIFVSELFFYKEVSTPTAGLEVTPDSADFISLTTLNPQPKCLKTRKCWMTV